MKIDYDNLREMIDLISPGPWKLIGEYPDGEPRPDTSFLVHTRGGEYMGIMHGDDARLTALAPDMARELLRLHDGIKAVRDRCATLAESAQEASMTALAAEMNVNAKALTGLLNGNAN